MSDQITIIGIVASICTGVSLLPQLFKIQKDMECNISLLMLAVVFLGNSFWIWYGVLKQDMILRIKESVCTTTCMSIFRRLGYPCHGLFRNS